MVSIFKNIIYLLLLVAIFSCDVSEIETDLEIPYKDDTLIIHGFISQGEGVNLIVQKTVPHSCTVCSDTVSNAKVFLYENGSFLFNLNTLDGFNYHAPSSFSPYLESEYHIVVEVDGMASAISSTIKPMKIVTIDTAYIEVTENPYKILVRYKFTDIPFERNQYIVRITSKDEVTGLLRIPFYFDEVIGDEVSVNGIIEGERLFFLNNDEDEIQVQLYHLSPQLVQYLYSKWANKITEVDPFREFPVPVYSNIRNGYGFFGSYGLDVYKVPF